MDLRNFFQHIHAGAFFVFDNIINHLSNSDRKSLRLVLHRPISDAVFGYMFDRLHFSINDEDLEVFQAIANHPVASRRVTQIFWNVTIFHNHIVPEYQQSQNYSDEYQLNLLASMLVRERARLHRTSMDLSQTINHLRAQGDLCKEACRFRSTREALWRSKALAGSDLQMLSQCIPKMANLRRINIVVETPGPCIVHQGDFDLWDTPRARVWKSLPFHDLLPVPRPRCRADVRVAFDRAVKGVDALCTSGDVGSLIVEPFCRDHLLREAGEHRADLGTQANTGSITRYSWRGTGQSISDIKGSRKLTVRLLLESHHSRENLWYAVAAQEEGVSCFQYDRLLSRCRESLEEISYCNFDPSLLLTRKIYEEGNWIQSVPLADSRGLRKVNLHEFSCDDITDCLRLLWRETSVRELELHSVSCKKTSWYAIMIKLREEEQTYDHFSMKSCRSPSELWGPEFGPETLAPWNGKSTDIVPWLRGEHNNFPLWQGPG